MATVVHEQIEVPLEDLRISWGGIWAGVLTVLGVLLFLTTLGLAVGITADARNANAGTVSAGAAIWSGLSLLIALFVGGMAATRLGMVFDKAAGAFEGALVWVLSFIAILWLASTGVWLMANGMSGMFGGMSDSAGSAMGNLSQAPDQSQMVATAWTTLLAMLLSLAAAVVGAMLGRRRLMRRLMREERVQTSVVD